MNLPYFLNTWIVYWDSSGGIAGRAGDGPRRLSQGASPTRAASPRRDDEE